MRLMAEIKKEKEKAGKCRGEHLPDIIINAKKAHPSDFQKLYTDGDGVLEKVLQGTPPPIHRNI